MGTETTIDAMVDDRRFAVIRGGRRWTKVPEYMGNGQLTARWFVDEATGEVRMARSWKSPESTPAGYLLVESSSVGQLVRRILTVADALDRPTRRDTLKVGEAFVGSWGEEIQRGIRALEWSDIEPRMPFTQGYVIREALAGFGIAKPTKVALDGTVRVALSGQWERVPLYGIEAEYPNARIRVYLLDQGAVATPLFVDVWEHDVAAVA